MGGFGGKKYIYSIRNFDVIHYYFVADLELTIYYGTAPPGLKMTGECIVIYINIICMPPQIIIYF